MNRLHALILIPTLLTFSAWAGDVPRFDVPPPPAVREVPAAQTGNTYNCYIDRYGRTVINGQVVEDAVRTQPNHVYYQQNTSK